MTQHSKFSEAALEQAIIELLGKEGYPYVKGDTITREPGQVLLHADLRVFLAKQYAADQITPQEIEAVINRLSAYSAADLYESNKAIMRLDSDGFHLNRNRTLTPSPSPKRRGEQEKGSSPLGRSGDEGRSQCNLYIQLIDYSELVAFREPNPGELGFPLAEQMIKKAS